ncbi:CLOCK-interacting pacemaker [Gastrophryne carolinensis]
MAAQERQQTRTSHKTAGRTANARRPPESDKDSGFSDVASECPSSLEQTDSEEATQNAPGCPTPHPPPLLILKNLLGDQGARPNPHAHSWTVRPSFQLLPTSSQILVFPPSVTAPKPPPSREKPTNYLPILNSYPKIAPHPSKQPTWGNKREAELWPRNPSKRHRPGSSKKASSSINAPVGEEPLDEVLAYPQPNPSNPLSDTIDLSGAFSGDPQAADASHKTELLCPPPQQNKDRRFQNTLDILHRSGLLSIAIKTKELARLNQATQRQLEKLQEQVSLYTKAISTNCPEDWQRLQELLVTEPTKELDM